MLKSLLSLVTPGNKEKKKLALTGSPASASRQTDASFISEADVSILNDTSVTIPIDDGFGDTSISRVLGDASFTSPGRKYRAASFDFCLTDEKSEKEVVVRRRSLQPRPATPSPSPSDADHSFIENIFDSPNQKNRLHSMIGDKIYETPSSSPPPFTNKVAREKL